MLFTFFQIPAAPVAHIDFSSAKSKKQKLDDAIAGRSTEQHTVEKPVQCPKVKRGSEEYDKFFHELSRNCPRSAALIFKEKYHKAFVPKSCMLPKTVLGYRTPVTLQLAPKELGELCQDFQVVSIGYLFSSREMYL